MWLAGVRGPVAARFGGRAGAFDEGERGAPPPRQTRALVPVAPARPALDPRAPASRPLAPFLAQLIATRQDAPQTRGRRRTDYDTAVTEYEEIAGSPDEPRRPEAIRSI